MSYAVFQFQRAPSMPAKNTPYFISYYPNHPATPWKLEFRASFAGKRIKRFFASKAEAETTGPLLVAQIRAQGTTAALAEQKPSGTLLSAILATFRQHKVRYLTGRHLQTAKH